jgi:hypothetical protein
MTTIQFEINRLTKGSHTYFFPTVNGKRISKVNWARKYDAQNLIKSFRQKFTTDQINEMLTK